MIDLLPLVNEPIIGLAAGIEREWVKFSISMMKSGKAARPSGTMAEMLTASSEFGYQSYYQTSKLLHMSRCSSFRLLYSIVNFYKGRRWCLG